MTGAMGATEGGKEPSPAPRKGNDVAFIQIIEFRTSDLDAMESVAARWEEATAGKRTAGRRIPMPCRTA